MNNERLQVTGCNNLNTPDHVQHGGVVVVAPAALSRPSVL